MPCMFVRNGKACHHIILMLVLPSYLGMIEEWTSSGVDMKRIGSYMAPWRRMHRYTSIVALEKTVISCLEK